MSDLNQLFIWSKLLLDQPADAPKLAGTTFMAALVGSYW